MKYLVNFPDRVHRRKWEKFPMKARSSHQVFDGIHRLDALVGAIEQFVVDLHDCHIDGRQRLATFEVVIESE